MTEDLAALQKARGDVRAPRGTVWVCSACGKTSQTRWGMNLEKSAGWDESCMMNAVIVHTADIVDPPEWRPYARVRKIK